MKKSFYCVTAVRRTRSDRAFVQHPLELHKTVFKGTELELKKKFRQTSFTHPHVVQNL